MAKQIHIPGHGPKLEIGLLAAAQELQTILDNTTGNPAWQSEMLEQALELVGTSDELLGGKWVFIHTHDAFVINPVESEHFPNIDRNEWHYGEMIVKAYFNGVAHFETIGSTALNSLCLDLSEVKMVKDYDMDFYAPGQPLPGTFVVPVKSVEHVLAAA